MRLVSLICKATTSHPMVLFEFRNVSLRLCLRGSPVDSAAHAVAAVLQKHNFSEACFVSHSFGTFVSSRVCQMYKSMVQSLVSFLVAKTVESGSRKLRAVSEVFEAALHLMHRMYMMRCFVHTRRPGLCAGGAWSYADRTCCQR